MTSSSTRRAPPSGDYHDRIRSAVERSDIFVFLMSPDAIAPGSYTLSELKHARTKWPHPKGRVLPVLVRAVSWDVAPSYLKAATVRKPEGNIPAEVVAAVRSMVPPAHTRWGIMGAFAILLAAVAIVIWRPSGNVPDGEPAVPSRPSTAVNPQPLLARDDVVATRVWQQAWVAVRDRHHVPKGYVTDPWGNLFTKRAELLKVLKRVDVGTDPEIHALRNKIIAYIEQAPAQKGGASYAFIPESYDIIYDDRMREDIDELEWRIRTRAIEHGVDVGGHASP